MKKLIFIGALSVLFAVHPVMAADDLTEGLKPLQPTGLFSIFSTKTQDPGKITIEPGLEFVSEPDVSRVRLNVGYGILENWDVALAGSASDTGGHEGIEDLTLGVRYRFLEEIMFGPSGAVLLTISLPLGKEKEGFGSGYVETAGLLVISKRIGPFTGHANAGYNVVHASREEDETILAGGIEFSAAKNLKLLAELYGKSSQERDLYELRFGYRSVLSPGLSNTVGFGFGINDRDPDYRFTVLFSFTYPRDEEPIIRVPDR